MMRQLSPFSPSPLPMHTQPIRSIARLLPHSLCCLLICACFASLSSEEQTDYPDLIFLANGQSMQVLLERLPKPEDKELLLKTPGGGELAIDQSLVAEIRPGLDHRLAHYNKHDLNEQLELARYCLAAQRKEAALKLFEAVHAQKKLPPSQLRSLAQLTDQFHGPEAALPLYQLYRDQKGKDTVTLGRLQVLEDAIAAHKEKVAEIYAKNPSAKTISEGLEKMTTWRTENIKWANPVSVTNHPIEMGGNRINTVLQADYEGGEKQKASIVLPTKIDVREQNMFTFFISNPSKNDIRISIAVKCGDRWDYFESRSKSVSAQSVWEEVSFDLKRNDFKSQASEWQHKDKISQPEAIREIQILMHNDKASGTLLIDGIGFSSSQKEM